MNANSLDENCALLSCYTTSSGQFSVDILGQLMGPIFRGYDETDSFYSKTN